MARATTLDDFSDFLRLKELPELPEDGDEESLEDPQWEWFVDTDLARGERVAARVTRNLVAAYRSGRVSRMLFAGHTGCGKSSELARVQRMPELRNLYKMRFARAERELTLTSLTAHQLLLYCVRHVIDVVLGNGELCLKLEGEHRKLLERLTEWFDKRTVEMVLRDQASRSQSPGSVSVAFLRSLFVKYETTFARGTEHKTVITRHVEERIDSLREPLESLLDILHAAIAPRRLLLIVDGVDKVSDIELGIKVFRDGRLLLDILPCSVIFTLPIALWYENATSIGYDDSILLPMLPVVAPPPREGLTDEQRMLKRDRGLKVLREIVEKRVDRGLIDDDALDAAIRRSGGVIRDLFKMLIDAALEASVEGRRGVARADVDPAFHRLRDRTYRAALAPPLNVSDRQSGITTETIARTLGTVETWPRYDFALEPTGRMLAQRLCILEYNGETWHDLHPAVRDLLRIFRDEQNRRNVG